MSSTDDDALYQTEKVPPPSGAVCANCGKPYGKHFLCGGVTWCVKSGDETFAPSDLIVDTVCGRCGMTYREHWGTMGGTVWCTYLGYETKNPALMFVPPKQGQDKEPEVYPASATMSEDKKLTSKTVFLHSFRWKDGGYPSVNERVQLSQGRFKCNSCSELPFFLYNVSRTTRNPRMEPELKGLSGLELGVQEMMNQCNCSRAMIRKIVADIAFVSVLPTGSPNQTGWIGCTTGQHQSVAVVELVAQTLRKRPDAASWDIHITHHRLEKVGKKSC